MASKFCKRIIRDLLQSHFRKSSEVKIAEHIAIIMDVDIGKKMVDGAEQEHQMIMIFVGCNKNPLNLFVQYK